MRVFANACLLAATSGLSTAGFAVASDGNLPRTPMLHREEQCLTIVDRTKTPVVHLAYTIPFADTCVAGHEPVGSRSHRYVALCRTPGPAEPLPHWLTSKDVEASLASGVLLEQERPPSDDLLDHSPAWADCHALVGALEARHSIHCTDAARGFDWDTTGLSAGIWVLAGYTYHPPMNMWTPRLGVFKLVDGAKDDFPAIGLHPHPRYAGEDHPLEVSVCVDAAPHSTVRIAAALVEDPASWVALTSKAIEVDEREIDFQLELGTSFHGGSSIVLKAEIEDSSGRSFEYISPDPILYVAGPTPQEPPSPYHAYCEDPSAFEPQVCPPIVTDDDDDDNEPSGCASCSMGPVSLRTLTCFLVLAASRPRRRRRNSIRS